jgi:hypothetical protein
MMNDSLRGMVAGLQSEEHKKANRKPIEEAILITIDKLYE